MARKTGVNDARKMTEMLRLRAVAGAPPRVANQILEK